MFGFRDWRLGLESGFGLGVWGFDFDLGFGDGVWVFGLELGFGAEFGVSVKSWISGLGFGDPL